MSPLLVPPWYRLRVGGTIVELTAPQRAPRPRNGLRRNGEGIGSGRIDMGGCLALHGDGVSTCLSRLGRAAVGAAVLAERTVVGNGSAAGVGGFGVDGIGQRLAIGAAVLCDPAFKRYGSLVSHGNSDRIGAGVSVVLVRSIAVHILGHDVDGNDNIAGLVSGRGQCGTAKRRRVAGSNCEFDCPLCIADQRAQVKRVSALGQRRGSGDCGSLIQGSDAEGLFSGAGIVAPTGDLHRCGTHIGISFVAVSKVGIFSQRRAIGNLGLRRDGAAGIGLAVHRGKHSIIDAF